jgi:uncharacterized protein with HEPN domain
VKDDGVYIEYILESVDLLRQWTIEGRSSLNDVKTSAAVLHRLQTLAESAKRISARLKEQHPEIPWSGIISIRNVIVHDYMSLDLDLIWKAIDERLLPLRVQLAAILETLPPLPPNP